MGIKKIRCTCICHSNPSTLHVVACCNDGWKEIPDDTEEENKPSGHICPYCEQKNMLINDHFSHIEMFHPGKPLI